MVHPLIYETDSHWGAHQSGRRTVEVWKRIRSQLGAGKRRKRWLAAGRRSCGACQRAGPRSADNGTRHPVLQRKFSGRYSEGQGRPAIWPSNRPLPGDTTFSGFTESSEISVHNPETGRILSVLDGFAFFGEEITDHGEQEKNDDGVDCGEPRLLSGSSGEDRTGRDDPGPRKGGHGRRCPRQGGEQTRSGRNVRRSQAMRCVV